MKKLYFFALVALAISTATAQVDDVVITGEGYANQVWYSMENGEVGSAPLNNWDLAFEISGFTSSIRANTQKGLLVYQAPFATEEWDDLTELNASWPLLYNDITSWNRGALNLHPTSDFDIGWGIYNPITHFVTGDSLYIVQLADGGIKKLRVDVLASGVYTFTYANLDGSGELQKQLVKDDYTGKNFGYFSFETGEVLDREPLTEEWDITFTRYSGLIQGQMYRFSGIQHNYGIRVAEVANTPVDEADPWSIGFESEIDIIGDDWKAFTGAWSIVPDLSYFIEAQNGNVYQIVFSDFGGTSTGVYEFSVDLYSALSIASGESMQFSAFPNPLNAGSQLTLEGNFDPNMRLEVFSADGKMVSEQLLQNQNQVLLNTAGYDPGIYLIRIVSVNETFTQKVIINK